LRVTKSLICDVVIDLNSTASLLMSTRSFSAAFAVSASSPHQNADRSYLTANSQSRNPWQQIHRRSLNSRTKIRLTSAQNFVERPESAVNEGCTSRRNGRPNYSTLFPLHYPPFLQLLLLLLLLPDYQSIARRLQSNLLLEEQEEGDRVYQVYLSSVRFLRVAEERTEIA
jgi:hypothetical protein